jgi:hypothetical protein
MVAGLPRTMALRWRLSITGAVYANASAAAYWMMYVVRNSSERFWLEPCSESP